MLSSRAGDLAGAPDGHDALFFVESGPETLGQIILYVLKNLNGHTSSQSHYIFNAAINDINEQVVSHLSNEEVKLF